MPLISGRPARAQVSLYPVACTCTVMLFPVTLVPAAGEVIVMCMCLAPIGSIPLPIDMDGLAIGPRPAIFGLGRLERAPRPGGGPRRAAPPRYQRNRRHTNPSPEGRTRPRAAGRYEFGHPQTFLGARTR